MAISEAEAARLIDVIETTIRAHAEPEAHGIIDLLNQWRSDVEAGRPVERKLPVRQSQGFDELADSPRSRAATSGEFVGKEDYRSVEQLDMLVTAIGIAFIAPRMMATRLLETIENCSEEMPSTKAYPAVHLVGVETDGLNGSSLISPANIAQSRTATTQLERILNEIITEAELAPRTLGDDEGTPR